MKNQYKSNVITGKQALVGMANGIHIAAAPVRGTMGSAGKNVVIQVDLPPYHIITNDGATIIEHTYLEDQLESRGLSFLKEGVSRSNKISGDGSSATVTILDETMQEGVKTDASMNLKRSLEECIPIIESYIDSTKKEVLPKDIELVAQVATTASEDPVFGNLLAEIYSKVGKDGIIQPEYVLGKQGYSYSFIQGVRFAHGCGYLSPMMVHDEEAIKEKRRETRAVYENPLVLVTKRKISNVREINGLLAKIGTKRDVVIFTDDMDSQVASFMIATHQQRKMNPVADLPRITVIKAPVLWKQYVFEDFAKCVGATIVEDATGVNFKNLDAEHLGTCNKIIIDKDETVIIGTKDLTDHIADLQKVVDDGDTGDNDFARRISWLTTKTVLLKVGGMSDTQISYKRLKIDDTISSTRLALQDGIVAGGGVALLNASENLPDTIGGEVLKKALKAPIRQIVTNYGEDFSKLQVGDTKGFDTRAGKVVDMFEAGIIDSALVVKNSVKNALSIAATVLSVDADIALPRKSEQEALLSMLTPKNPFQ